MYPLPIQAFAPQTLCDHLGFLGIMARATCRKKDPRPSKTFWGDSLINLFPMLREQQTPNTTPHFTSLFRKLPLPNHRILYLYEISKFVPSKFSSQKKTIKSLTSKSSKFLPAFFVQRICHGLFVEVNKKKALQALHTDFFRDGTELSF